MGIPFIIMGKKEFNCTHEGDRNRSLKKTRLDEKVEKACIYMKRLKHTNIRIYIIYLYTDIY